MTARSKYSEQRLTAKQVLQRYGAGERDFRGAILDGCDFCEANLSGADFSGAKIRGTRFVDATLIGTKFCHAEAGPSTGRRIFQLLAALIAIPCGFLQAVASFYFGLAVTTLGADPLGSHFPIIAMATAAIILITVVIIGARVIAGVGAVGLAALVTTVTAFPVGLLGGFLAVFSLGASEAYDSSIVFVIGVVVVWGIAIAIMGTNFWLSESVERHIHQSDPTFETLHNLSVWGGTAFNGATLTEASFTSAILNQANFANSRQRSTVLTRVRWQNAQKLEQAHLGTTYLCDQRVRHLLTCFTGSGLNGQTPLDLSNADLRGVNLAGAQLHRINFRKANLTGATLAGAQLQGANLTGARCWGSNFTAAHLTGACIKAWKINRATVLKDIDCQYIFLEEGLIIDGYRDRRPSNRDDIFQPGDFEQLFQGHG
ncbi:MAG: pentapeptide repeat-containing protein [Cyanobacteria bacterium P01_H01_bin.153]